MSPTRSWIIAVVVAAIAPAPVYADSKNEIRAVTFDEDGATTRVHVRGAQTPTFTVYKLERPSRVVIDVPQARLADVLRGHESAALMTANTWAVSTIAAQQMDDGGQTVRVIVTLARPGRYDVKTEGNEMVVMVMARDPAPVMASPEALAAAERSRAQAEQGRAAAEKSNAQAQADAAKAKDAAAAAQAAAATTQQTAARETDAARAEAAKAKADADAARADAARSKAAADANQVKAQQQLDAAAKAQAEARVAAQQQLDAAAKAQAEARVAAQQQLDAATKAKAEADAARREAEAARHDAEAAKAEAARTRAQAAAAKDDVARTKAEAVAARSEADKASALARASKAETDAARADAAHNQAEAEAARRQADVAAREAAQKNAEVAAAQAEAARMKDDNARMHADASRARSEAEAAKAEVARMRTEAEAARSEAEAAKTQAAADKRDAETARGRAEAALRDAKQQVATLDKKAQAAQALEDKARATSAAAQAREESARQMASQAASERQAAEAAAKQAAEARDRSAQAGAERDKAISLAQAAEARLAAARKATDDAEHQRAAAETAATTARHQLDDTRTALATVEQQRTAAETAASDAARKRGEAEAAASDAARRRSEAETAAGEATKQRAVAEHAATAAQQRRGEAEAQRIAAEQQRATAEQATRAATAAAAAAEHQRTVAEAAAATAVGAKRDAEAGLAELSSRRQAAERAASELETRSKAEAKAQAEVAAATARKATDNELAAVHAEVNRLADERKRAEAELADRRKAVAAQQAEADRLKLAAGQAHDAADREDARRAVLAEERAAEERALAKIQAQRSAQLAAASSPAAKSGGAGQASSSAPVAGSGTTTALVAPSTKSGSMGQAGSSAPGAASGTTTGLVASSTKSWGAGQAGSSTPGAASGTTTALVAPSTKSGSMGQAGSGTVTTAAPIVLASADTAPAASAAATSTKPAANGKAPLAHVKDIAFTGDDATSRVSIAVTGDANVHVGDVSATAAELIIDHADLATKLERKLDVSRFGGPVRAVSSFHDRRVPDRVRLIVELSSPATPSFDRDTGIIRWNFVGDNIAKRPVTTRPGVAAAPTGPVIGGFGAASTPVVQQSVAQLPPQGNRRRVYHGQTMELHFKDAPIHDLLRLIADVGKVSIVVPDTIEAKVTVDLKRVPWDQALEVILSSHQLWYRREGNLYRIAPRKELDAEDEAEAARVAAQLKAESPRPGLVSLNYASASDLSKKLEPMLSPHGKIAVDERTNQLIVTDVTGNREQISRLAQSLDTQTPQISIEARIVEADSTFLRQIGIQWGGNANSGSTGGNATGLTFPSTIALLGGNEDANTNRNGVANPSNFAINLPAATGTGEGGAVGLSLGSVSGNFNINVRLSALEDTGTVRIISAPKVTVLNNKSASIASGVSIPISTVSATGTQTQFVQADLKLDVTPTVSQRDCSISMSINVTDNQPDFVNVGARGDPSIVRKEAHTSMLVADGDTKVLGGIYTRNSSLTFKKVPFLGDLPVIGWLFKNRREQDDRTELLVFITPRITNRALLNCK